MKRSITIHNKRIVFHYMLSTTKFLTLTLRIAVLTLKSKLITYKENTISPHVKNLKNEFKKPVKKRKESGMLNLSKFKSQLNNIDINQTMKPVISTRSTLNWIKLKKTKPTTLSNTTLVKLMNAKQMIKTKKMRKHSLRKLKPLLVLISTSNQWAQRGLSKKMVNKSTREWNWNNLSQKSWI